MQNLFAWFRGRRGVSQARFLTAFRGVVPGSVIVCFVLVAVLGLLQFQWIRQVTASQLELKRMVLHSPISSAIEEFQDEIALLLATFQARADRDPSNRLQTFMDSYLSWQAQSKHVPALKRILFYDRQPSGPQRLSELLVESQTIKPAVQDLAFVRRHLDKVSVTPEFIAGRWSVGTWMCLPQSMVLYRPIDGIEAGGVGSSRNASLDSFLILQLDLDSIRDTLIPQVLVEHFDRIKDPDRFDRYVFSVVLDSKNLWVYDRDDQVDDTGRTLSYSLRSSRESGRPDHLMRADSTFVFPLRNYLVPQPMAQFGAIQRVLLRSREDIRRLAGPSPLPATLESEASQTFIYGKAEKVVELRRSGQLPRLFVFGDTPYTLSLRARREGVSLEEASNRRHTRSMAIGTVVLLLLVGAIGMVATSARQAARLAAMRVDAAAAQSHQLRNPLAAISVLADSMAQGALTSAEKVVLYGKRIQSYSERLTEIVDRTARMAALDRSTRPYHLKLVDVSEVVREVFDEARPVVEEAGFAAECVVAEGVPKVRADVQALRQGLNDLLGNAVKYGLPGRWVRIETALTGSGSKREVQIRVHDRGCGIPAHAAKMVFEPFYRVGDVADSSIPGSGLGLTLVRNAVEGMGGKLTLESEVGRGSVFTISFPVPEQ